jgi:hypothetical protein
VSASSPSASSKRCDTSRQAAWAAPPASAGPSAGRRADHPDLRVGWVMLSRSGRRAYRWRCASRRLVSRSPLVTSGPGASWRTGASVDVQGAGQGAQLGVAPQPAHARGEGRWVRISLNGGRAHPLPGRCLAAPAIAWPGQPQEPARTQVNAPARHATQRPFLVRVPGQEGPGLVLCSQPRRRRQPLSSRWLRTRRRWARPRTRSGRCRDGAGSPWH